MTKFFEKIPTIALQSPNQHRHVNLSSIWVVAKMQEYTTMDKVPPELVQTTNESLLSPK